MVMRDACGDMGVARKVSGCIACNSNIIFYSRPQISLGWFVNSKIIIWKHIKKILKLFGGKDWQIFWMLVRFHHDRTFMEVMAKITKLALQNAFENSTFGDRFCFFPWLPRMFFYDEILQAPRKFVNVFQKQNIVFVFSSFFPEFTVHPSYNNNNDTISISTT